MLLARHRAAATPGIQPGEAPPRRLANPDRYPGDPFTAPAVEAPAAERRPARRKPAAASS